MNRRRGALYPHALTVLRLSGEGQSLTQLSLSAARGGIPNISKLEKNHPSCNEILQSNQIIAISLELDYEIMVSILRPLIPAIKLYVADSDLLCHSKLMQHSPRIPTPWNVELR